MFAYKDRHPLAFLSSTVPVETMTAPYKNSITQINVFIAIFCLFLYNNYGDENE